jgi:hypothetical protein
MPWKMTLQRQRGKSPLAIETIDDCYCRAAWRSSGLRKLPSFTNLDENRRGSIPGRHENYAHRLLEKYVAIHYCDIRKSYRTASGSKQETPDVRELSTPN